MIIQFPNGAAIDSSVIASIHVIRQEVRGEITCPAIIVVYTFREEFGLNMFGRSKPTASHFLSIPMPSDLDAENECRNLVAKWMGLPDPELIQPIKVTHPNG